ncbi:hypothetical protein EIP91_009666 [Steccherinum ochraceum]|uniref:Uncharacterized protein n=1 Tax=Steccherinum ochraceum TaxID=92696 RepID=A0A4R0RE10_9APHY|nr:hypothetical protein EIP91_009666 [Steccherinum ochraceum]
MPWTWTDEPRRSWLEENNDDFKANVSRSDPERSKTWWETHLFPRWFKAFPSRNPTRNEIRDFKGDVEAAKQDIIALDTKRVKNWYHNRNRAARASSSSKKILDLGGRRKLNKYQYYYKLNKKTLRPTYAKKYQSHRRKQLAAGEQPINAAVFYQGMAKKAFEKEPKDLRDAVSKLAKGERDVALPGESDAAKRLRLLAARKRAFSKLVNTIGHNAVACNELTGSISVTLVAGIDPTSGDLFSFHHHCGENSKDKTFEEYLPSFDKDVYEPFKKFASTAFSSKDRRYWSVAPEDPPLDDIDSEDEFKGLDGEEWEDVEDDDDDDDDEGGGDEGGDASNARTAAKTNDKGKGVMRNNNAGTSTSNASAAGPSRPSRTAAKVDKGKGVARPSTSVSHSDPSAAGPSSHPTALSAQPVVTKTGPPKRKSNASSTAAAASASHSVVTKVGHPGRKRKMPDDEDIAQNDPPTHAAPDLSTRPAKALPKAPPRLRISTGRKAPPRPSNVSAPSASQPSTSKVSVKLEDFSVSQPPSNQLSLRSRQPVVFDSDIEIIEPPISQPKKKARLQPIPPLKPKKGQMLLDFVEIPERRKLVKKAAPESPLPPSSPPSSPRRSFSPSSPLDVDFSPVISSSVFGSSPVPLRFAVGRQDFSSARQDPASRLLTPVPTQPRGGCKDPNDKKRKREHDDEGDEDDGPSASTSNSGNARAGVHQSNASTRTVAASKAVAKKSDSTPRRSDASTSRSAANAVASTSRSATNAVASTSSLMEFEERMGYLCHGPGVSTKDCPPDITFWLKNPSYDPRDMPLFSSADLHEFIVQLRRWWMLVQPTWRQNLARSLDNLDNKNWKTLQHGGPKGLFLFVLGLAWWLAAAPGDLTEVFDTARDVKYVLDNIPAPRSRR